MQDQVKTAIIRWINRNLTVAHIEIIARVAGCRPSELVAFHPSFRAQEKV